MPGMRDLIQELQESSYDAEKVAADFLSITPQKYVDRVKQYLDIVLTAHNGHSDIYGPDYKEAKMYFGRALDSMNGAWSERISGPFTAGRGGDNPETDLSWYINSPSSLHDMISKKKKWDKLKPTTVLNKHTGRKFSEVDPAMVKALGELIDKSYRLANIMKDLKTKVVKGRKPNPAAAAKKQAMMDNRDMKTCACCFRSIARLKNGLIADHGYTLKWKWGKTQSCPGRQFKPLEVSNEGLKYMRDGLKKLIKQTQDDIKKAPNVTKLPYKRYGGKVEIIGPDHKWWKKVHDSHILGLNSQLKNAEHDLKEFEARLRIWAKTSD